MACVKNQIAPWGDPLMLENPGEELYFGEVYRQILQEAWLPKGSELWERVGKSRRGSRPTQKGLYAHSPTEAQAIVRQCFSKCAAAWRALPWDNPIDTSCDNRWGKQYWYDFKHNEGYPCSYYDLFMRFCMRHCIDTGWVMPSAYLLSSKADLSHVECNKIYDLAFPNKCGEVSMVSGEGEFVAPGEWVSPKCGTEGDLCFKDVNGSLGFISYKFSPLHWCTEFIWPSINPSEIDPNESKPVYVEGGVPPYTWLCEGADMSLSASITNDPVNSLHAGPDAGGTAHIKVNDICGNEITGHVMCSVGQWVVKSNDCVLKGDGELYFSFGYERWHRLIIGYRKQQQYSVYTAILGIPGECPDPICSQCLAWCGPNCENCINPDVHSPHWYCDCVDSSKGNCWRASFEYFEWEC